MIRQLCDLRQSLTLSLSGPQIPQLNHRLLQDASHMELTLYKPTVRDRSQWESEEIAGFGKGDVGLKEEGSPPSSSGWEQGHLAESAFRTKPQVPKGPVQSAFW